MASNSELRAENLDAGVVASLAATIGIFATLITADPVSGASLAISSALLCFVYRLVLAVEHLAYGT